MWLIVVVVKQTELFMYVAVLIFLQLVKLVLTMANFACVIDLSKLCHNINTIAANTNLSFNAVLFVITPKDNGILQQLRSLKAYRFQVYHSLRRTDIRVSLRLVSGFCCTAEGHRPLKTWIYWFRCSWKWLLHQLWSECLARSILRWLERLMKSLQKKKYKLIYHPI